MDRVCPLLALAVDGRTAVDGADPGHRCHAEQPPTSLERYQQVRVCLTDAHQRCERFLGHEARTGGARPRLVPIGDGLISTRMVLTPQPAWRGIAGQARRADVARLLAVGLGVVLLGAGGIAVASAALRGEDGAALVGPGDPSPSPTRRPTPSPTTSPSPSPSPTPSPTPAPTLAPTPQPTPTPTVPPPPPVQTYVVQEGDTLAAIAAQFGTTTAALQAANDIEDPNTIFIGQQLVIP
ncbi:MAG: LysM peptidoglycan-binding domain-containing protein [Candidatus Limnocylindria bacterium]